MIINCNNLFDYIREHGEDGVYQDYPSKFLYLDNKKLHAVYDSEIYIVGGEPGNWIEDTREVKVIYMEE